MNLTPSPHFDLNDRHLFGSEAAESESSAEVFASYFFVRPEFKGFTESEQQLLIINGYKGEGKSAILRAAEQALKHRPHALTLRISSYDLSATDCGDSYDNWLRSWRLSIISRVAIELGKTIGFAWSDDDIKAVELSEREGGRQKNVVGLIIERFVLKVKVHAAEIQLKDSTTGVTESSLRRQCEDKEIWLLIDDADANFVNTVAGRHKVAGLYTAARQLCQSIPNLRIRTTVRPTTWVVLYSAVEDMTHVREYLMDLYWDTHDIKNILFKRIDAYLKRTNQSSLMDSSLDAGRKQEATIALLFGEQWSWAKIKPNDNGLRPPHLVLSNLSKDRPRWLIELCKEASKIAAKRRSEIITKEDVIDCLADFGRRRLSNLISEFRPECDQIETLLNAFVDQHEDYKTARLLEVVKNRITNHADIRIAGEVGRCDSMKVAHFLFKIGFLTARKDYSDSYEHASYSQKPSLLRDKANPDQGYSWEIHPIFRQALNIRDSQGNRVNSARKTSGKERK